MENPSGNIKTPHYLREYRRLLQTLKSRHGDEDTAYEKAVGGNYEGEAKFQAALVRSVAPAGPFNLLDIGCGSGRAAYGLRDEPRISYLGTDILPELLDYARKKTNRPDWRFEQVSEIAVPANDGWADVALVMSVFTHLKTPEIKQYLRAIARAMKPGGAIIISYLDRSNAGHRAIFQPAPIQRLARLIGRDVMLSFTTPDALGALLEAAGFAVEDTISYETPRQHTMIARKKASGPTS